MKFKQGVIQTLEKKQRIWSNRIKHFGEPRVITVGISNFCSNFKWHLFYDYDIEDKWIDERVENKDWKDYTIIRTKHGIQLISMKCEKLGEVRDRYLELKQTISSDYFWSTPLFLRISEKVDENGRIVSPAPNTFDIIPKEILLNHFLDRKLYRTWD